MNKTTPPQNPRCAGCGCELDDWTPDSERSLCAACEEDLWIRPCSWPGKEQ